MNYSGDREVTTNDRRGILQTLSSHYQVDSRLFLDLEKQVYDQHKNDFHQYSLILNREAGRIVTSQRPNSAMSQNTVPPARTMQQNPQSLPPRMQQNQPPQQHMKGQMLSQRQNPNSMYQPPMGMPHYSMQQRSQPPHPSHPQHNPPQYGRQMSPGNYGGNMEGMYPGNMKTMNPQGGQPQFNQYPPAPSQPFMQSMSRTPYPPSQYQSQNSAPLPGSYPVPNQQGPNYTSYPSSSLPSYPTNNISYRQRDRASVQASNPAPTTTAPPPKKDNIEEFRTKANEMKHSYLSKLIEMIADVGKIKQNDKGAESQKQYEEIQKKLTLLKTLITADFKPNSNFPPRKEILDAAEKQITMWIAEWEKLMRFASEHTQPTTAIGIDATDGDNQTTQPQQPTQPQSVNVKTESNVNFSQGTNDAASQSQQSNGGQDFATTNGPTSDLQAFDSSDLSTLLDLGLDFEPQDNANSYSGSSGRYSSDNYPPESYSGSFSNNDGYLNNKNYPDTQQYSEDPNNFDGYQNSFNQHGDTNNYSDSYPDNFQDNSYGTFPDPGQDQVNDVFGDLENNSRFLPTQQVLGKRKAGEDYADSEQPPKYSKTNPM